METRSSEFFSLKEKVAAVTGGASGIGKAIAKRFAEAGATVYVLDLLQDEAEAVAAEIRAEGGRAQSMNLDVSDPDECQGIARRLLSEVPRGLDILVNNAGIGAVGTIETTEAGTLDNLYRVNVRGVFNMSKVLVGKMIQNKAGSIINIASVVGLVGIVDRVAYASSKFAVVGLTKSMALDHATTGVRVNCICPARVRTPFVERRIGEYRDPEAARLEMTSSQPMERMAEPEEIAAAAHYLASDDSAFVTGSHLCVDGGYSAR